MVNKQLKLIKNKLKLLLILLILLPVKALPQDSLDLIECYKTVLQNDPLNKQKPIIRISSELKTKSISTGWYPKTDFNAQATYQSDVTSVNIPPGLPISGLIPKPSLDQYRMTLDVNQVIFDGSLIGSQKDLEKYDAEVNLAQVEVDLNKLKQQINIPYFTILLLQKNDEILKVKYDEIIEKLKVIESGIRNGAILPSNKDILEAELIKIEQQRLEIQSNKLIAFNTLSELLGKKIESGTKLSSPEINISYNDSLKRPEYQFFKYQEKKLDAASELASVQNNPKLFAFGEVGYGKPGFNMLSNEFKTFYIVGAKLNWTILDWNKSSDDAENLMVQKKLVDVNKEIFDRNLRIALNKEKETIENLNSLIEKDKEIIKLRENITKSASSQLTNGVITATDYLNQLNDEIIAKINKETHLIQLIQSKVNYMNLKGDM
ncbi:MAG: TolC family protein, partial [FCB group bacterium]